MDSYFLAEMFKYLYLLFSPTHRSDFPPGSKVEPPGIDIENYLLTTEAHLIPLHLSTVTVGANKTSSEKVGQTNLIHFLCISHTFCTVTLSALFKNCSLHFWICVEVFVYVFLNYLVDAFFLLECICSISLLSANLEVLH